MSDSLWPHKLQHARPPCPSPTPRVYPNSCPLSRWCHPTISSSVFPFSSWSQSFPASGSFQMSQFLASGGQSIGLSASTSVLPMITQDWSPFLLCLNKHWSCFLDGEESQPVSVSCRWWCQAAGGADAAQAVAGMFWVTLLLLPEDLVLR